MPSSKTLKTELRRQRREAEWQEYEESVAQQGICSHDNAVATRFHWGTGKPAELFCPDCQATKYFDNEDLNDDQRKL